MTLGLQDVPAGVERNIRGASSIRCWVPTAGLTHGMSSDVEPADDFSEMQYETKSHIAPLENCSFCMCRAQHPEVLTAIPYPCSTQLAAKDQDGNKFYLSN